MSEFVRPYYFNLNKDGDFAIVRLLHTTLETIEEETLYTIELDGKKKRLKVNGDDTLLKEKKMESYQRMFIHLWDYTEESGNKEKVWDRTLTIKPQLQKLLESWNPLNSAVIKITRYGDSFPIYEIEPQNPLKYEEVAKELIDAEIAKFFHLTRKPEDIKVFLETGAFPEKKPFLSKEEYQKQQTQKESVVNSTTATKPVEKKTEPIDDDDLPF